MQCTHPIMRDTILIGYLRMLSVSALCSVDDRMINECGAVDGMNIGRGNRYV
jgi:hypothetical protein